MTVRHTFTALVGGEATVFKEEVRMKLTRILAAMLLLLSAALVAQAQLPAKRVLTLRFAKKIAEAAEAEAVKRGATVVDTIRGETR